MESLGVIIPQKRITQLKATSFDLWEPKWTVEIQDPKILNNLQGQENIGIECVDKNWFCHYKLFRNERNGKG